MRIVVNGQVIEGTPEEVTAFVRAMGGAAAPEPAPAGPTVAELWVEFVPYAETRIKSFGKHRNAVEAHAVSYFGPLRVSDVGQMDVDKYLAKRAAEPGRSGRMTSPTTRRRELTWIGSMLTWALKRKRIDRHPLRGLEVESTKGTRRRCYLDEPTFERLVAAAPTEIAGDMFRVWFWEGCRRDEIRLATKVELLDASRMLVIHGSRTKNGEDKVIPLAEPSYEIMRRWAAVSSGPWIFANPRDHSVPVPPSTLGYWFRRARTRSGVKGIGGKPDEVIVLHGLRRSFATGMAAVSAPLQLVQQGGGWADPEMAREYTQHHGETLETLRGYKNLRAGVIEPRIGPKPGDATRLALEARKKSRR